MSGVVLGTGIRVANRPHIFTCLPAVYLHQEDKSPAYEQVPAREGVQKSNLFISPTKLAEVLD